MIDGSCCCSMKLSVMPSSIHTCVSALRRRGRENECWASSPTECFFVCREEVEKLCHVSYLSALGMEYSQRVPASNRGRIRCVEMGMLAVKLQTRFAISIVTCTPRPADDDPMLSVVCVAYFDLLYRLYLCYGMYYDTLLYSP